MIYFLLIAGVWAAFLLPPALANRRSSPLSSTQEFNKMTRQLGKARSVSTDAPEAGIDREGVLARRRHILVALVTAVLGTLIGAISSGNLQLLLLNLIADAGLVWYIVMLLQIKKRQAAAISVVDIRLLTETVDRSQFQAISNG